MEVDGCKRKRPTPITLDWDKILSWDDNRPPEIIVTSSNKKQKYQTEDLEMVVKSDREVKETIDRVKSSLKLCGKFLPNGGERLKANLKRHEDELEIRRKMVVKSDCELYETIARVKNNLKLFGKFLPDGGKKLRANLKQHEDELERRLNKRQLMQKVDNECEETIKVSDSDDDGKRKEPTSLTLDWAKIFSTSTSDNDRPPNKKPKESLKHSIRTEALKLATKSNRKLNKAIARIKNNLKLCGKLPDGGEKLRAKLKLHKDELERRRRRQSLQKEREKTIQVSDDDGVSRGQKQGDRKSLSSPKFTKLFNKKLEGSEDGNDRPPEIIITSYKKPKESSENSYQTEDLELVTKSDHELNESIARIKQSLKQHEDELERRLKRQLLNKADNECEEMIQISDSDDGFSRGKKQGDRKSLSSPSFTKILDDVSYKKSCNGRTGKRKNQVAGKGRSRMAVSSSSQEPTRCSKSGLVDSEKQRTSNDDKSTSSFSVPNSAQVPPSSNLGPRTRPNYNLVDKDPPVQTAAQFMEELDPCVELLLGLRKPWNDTKTSLKDANC